MPKPRLGVFDLSMPGWLAGRSYTEAMLRSLLEARAEQRFELVRLTTRRAGDDDLDTLAFAPWRFWATPADALAARLERLPATLRESPNVARAGRVLGRLANRRAGSPLLRAGESARLSVLLPLLEIPAPTPYATVGWIPDFQHVHLPGYFTPAERSWRDHSFRQLARHASRVLLSSHAVRAHYDSFLPAERGKAAVASFPSMLCFEPPTRPRGGALARYHLPERFALVVNQLWAHKNPAVVVEAAALARDAGVLVPVVLVGLPSDYRDPENRTVSHLLQRIAELGLGGQVTVLGKVAFADLLDLLRCATVVVQPSRFEGWSTSVQDAKALGRPLLCSDLAVHREQAPGALGFFGCDDPPALARLLIEHFPGLRSGLVDDHEATALARERVFARQFGERIMTVCEAALGGPVASS